MNRDVGSVAANATDPVLARVDLDPNAPPHSVAIKWMDAMRSAVSVPPESHDNGFKQALILRHLTVDRVDTGLVVSTLAVRPPITNRYNTLHGGAVATIASIVGLAAVKTIAADKEFVQTEMSMSYLSAGRIGVELEVEAKVLRFGKSVAISSIEIRNKETKQTTYQASMALEGYGLDQIFRTRAITEDMWSSTGYYNELINSASLPFFDTDFINADNSILHASEGTPVHGIFNTSNVPNAAAIVNEDNVWDSSGYCNNSKFDWGEFEALSLQNELELICSNGTGVSHAGSDGGSLCMQKNFSRSTTTEESCYVTGGFHPYQDIEQNGRSLCTKSNSNNHSVDKTLDFDRTRGENNASADFRLRISDKTKAHCDLQSPQDCKTSLQTNNVTEGQRIIKNAKTLKGKNVVSKDDGGHNPLKKHLTTGGGSPTHVKPISGGGTKGKGQPAKNLHAERRRRKRLNERLCMLRSAVPTISKMDRTSILSDTIEYTKQLLSQIRHLHKELQPQADWPAHLRAYGPYFGSASDQYFADKTIPKFEVHRTDGWHLNIHMACQTNPNLLLSTVSTLESFGLEIEHGIFSCFGDFGMQAHCAEINKAHGDTRPEDIKLALLQKAGYLGKSEQRV